MPVSRSVNSEVHTRQRKVTNLIIGIKCVGLSAIAQYYYRIGIMYEGESNENLKYFLNTIYCAEVVQSCISFQHNLPHAQCKSSSACKVHKFL